VAYSPSVWPVPDRYIDGGKEAGPGSVASATFTAPMTQFKPVDKRTRLEDTAWRNSRAHLYNLIDGVRIADMSMGGPIFADTIGYPILGVTGDYYQFVSGGVIGTSSSLSGSMSAGATSVVVSSGTGFAIGKIISVGGTGTIAEEVRSVTAISPGLAPGTLTLNAALYQGHATGGTVISYASYNGVGHTFTLLNSGTGAGGSMSAQPPTYTYYDWTGVPAGSGARQYSFGRFSEVTITGSAEGLVMWDAKMVALASQIAGSTPSVIISPVAPQPAWVSTLAIAGAGTQNNAEWKLTLTQKTGPKFTNQGTQDPYANPAGYLDAALAFNFDPISDESEFNLYVNNTQPTIQIVAANNLPGTNAASLTINAQAAGFDAGEYDDTKDVFALTESAKLIASTALAGPSGGYSPVSLTLVNQVVNY